MSTPNDDQIITGDVLARMSPAELVNVMARATKIQGTVLIRDEHGNPKYDDPSLAGTYGEAQCPQREGVHHDS